MEKVLDHNCSNCDGILKFNPKTQCWKCEHCRKEYNLENLKSFLDQIQKENEQNLMIEENNVEIFNCPNCGAEILCGENTSVTSCVYCKNTAIIKKRLKGKYNPQYIIPFKISKEKAFENFIKNNKNKFFLPKDFKLQNKTEEFVGIYVPFWLYDYTLDASVILKCQKRKYNCIDNYKIVRKGSMQFENIPVDGSKIIDNSVMNSIEPFNYNEMIEFNSSYLSGFLSEKYDVCNEQSSKESRKRIEQSYINRIKQGLKEFDNIEIEEQKFYFRKEIAKYVLLPVWFINVRYKNEIYRFAINGQTGKIKGHTPIDNKKMNIFIVFMGIIVFLMSYIILNYILIYINKTINIDKLKNVTTNIIFVIISLILGIIISIILKFKIIYNSNTIRKSKSADIYKKKGSMEFHKKENIYLSSEPYNKDNIRRKN